MDLTYMEYLTVKLPINLPRLMIRHMSYVISVPQHELPYGELLTRVFEAFEGENRRRDDDVEAENEPAQAENNEINQEAIQENFEWEVVNEEEAQVQGEHIEKQAEKDADSGSGDQFYDAIDDVRSVDEEIVAPAALDVNDPAPVDIPAVQATPAITTTKQSNSHGD
ncbi:hypothetical protein Dimus_018251 [Dionaea muscipula]